MNDKYLDVEQVTGAHLKGGQIGSRYERLMQLIVAWQSARHIGSDKQRGNGRLANQR